MKPGESQNCRLQVSQEGATIQVNKERNRIEPSKHKTLCLLGDYNIDLFYHLLVKKSPPESLFWYDSTDRDNIFDTHSQQTVAFTWVLQVRGCADWYWSASCMYIV